MPYMRLSTLEKRYLCLRSLDPDVVDPEPVRVTALRTIEKMLSLLEADSAFARPRRRNHSWCRMRAMLSGRLIVPFLGLLVALGCANARLISADRTLELRPNQGILVVHVDSDFPIRKLQFGAHYEVATSILAGEYLVMAVVPAGDYHWTTIEVPGGYGRYYRFRIKPDGDWSFVVKPGAINYPGQIFVKGSKDTLDASGLMRAWTENRSAVILEKLRATYPKLLAQHPLEYARTERDDYLEVYQGLVPFGVSDPGNVSK
jgi:hypothetical protein